MLKNRKTIAFSKSFSHTPLKPDINAHTQIIIVINRNIAVNCQDLSEKNCYKIRFLKEKLF